MAGAHFAALLEGRPAGQASGVAEPGGSTAELISMWVGPGARGRGVGDALVRAVEEWARKAGAGELRLSVMPGNAHAAALYRRHGFEDMGPVGDELPDGGREHVMVKPLIRG
ncbi:GNAT family N-acetyltransferase [Streptomyces pini]|uniref:GNAT family N-acetyltransferase n=1 Tax=Streptomyces pini TaxID=1520580 RepID=UPI003182D861